MSIWGIAEYAGGILVPLGVFWAGDRGWLRGLGMEKSTPDSARGGSPESEAERGALPPLRSPSLGSGTSRTLPDVPKIQRGSRSTSGSLRF